MRVLLTGAGLLGRELVPQLAERHEVTLLDAADPGLGVPSCVGDLRDAAFVAEACRGMEAVVHTAALHGAAWAEAGDAAGFAVNVTGTYNVLEGARRAGAGRVVFTSSIWATGHQPAPPPYLPIDENVPREPIEVYGLTKKLGEQMAAYYSAQYALTTICVRPGGITPVDAPPERQFQWLFSCVDVRDVARAHVLALEASVDLRHDVFVAMPDSPLCGVPASTYFADPAGTLEGLVPGVGRFMDTRGIQPPSQPEWYTIAKSRRVLGYEPSHNFRVAD